MNLKKCHRCKDHKEISLFGTRSSNQDGKDIYCKSCVITYNNARKFKPNYKGSKRCSTCKETKEKVNFHKNRNITDGLEGRCIPCGQKRSRDIELKRRYNLTEDEFDKILKDQGGTCKICNNTSSNSRIVKLSVDHCHETGNVRGLLCSNCNMGLGRFKDNAELLSKAIEYLREA